MKREFYDDYFEEFEDKKYMEDKILNNSYNSGEIVYEGFTQPMKIDDAVSHLYSDTISDNIVEERIFKILDEKIYDVFKESPYYEKYKNPKRVDKNDMIKMYYYFKNKLIKQNTFSSIQMFIGFAEFFQINYDQLYLDIGVHDKEEILKELNDKFKLNTKIKTKKLF